MNERKNIHFMLYKADIPRLRSTTEIVCYLISISAVILKLMVKITSIFGSYRFLRISWHDIFSLSDHFPASWNLYIPRDLAESKSKCSSSRQSNPEVNYRTHLKDYCVSTSTASKRATNLHILVPAITRGTLARSHELKMYWPDQLSIVRSRFWGQTRRSLKAEVFLTRGGNLQRICACRRSKSQAA